MDFYIRGRDLSENIDNEEALKPLIPVLARMDGLSAGNSDYHEEKDLLEHSLMVYEAMLDLNTSDAALLTALSHDIGKILTQHQRTCAKHDIYGRNLIRDLYDGTEVDQDLVDTIMFCTEQHIRIKHVNGWQGQNPMKEGKVISTAKYYYGQEDKVEVLYDLIQADVKGRIPEQTVDHETIRSRLEKASEVVETVDRDYALDKRDATEDDYEDKHLNGMVVQDRIELLKEKQETDR